MTRRCSPLADLYRLGLEPETDSDLVDLFRAALAYQAEMLARRFVR